MTTSSREIYEGADIKFPHLYANDVCIGQFDIDYILRDVTYLQYKKNSVWLIVNSITDIYSIVF